VSKHFEVEKSKREIAEAKCDRV
jgi:hypothetical protein